MTLSALRLAISHPSSRPLASFIIPSPSLKHAHFRMAPPTDNRSLPPKEEAAFRQVLSLYESKQFDKAAKTADAILKKFPNNGQTISMKALVVFHTPATPGRSVVQNEAQGMDLAKLGVSKDADSQLCWHILGMLCRSQKDYLKASKSFNQALKADPHSLQILRDNANLSLHLRNHPVHLANRVTLLRLRPNERRNWINLAVAYDLNGELEKAEEVLSALADINSAPTAFDYEDSEVNMYRVSVLMEASNWSKALSVLNDLLPERRITDVLAATGFKAKALSKLGRKEEAEDCYRTLLEKNPDSHEVYRAFLTNKGLDLDNVTDEIRPKILRSLDLLGSLYPRAGAPRRLALDYAQDDDFKTLVENYLTAGLERGVPSLFSDLKALYANASKRTSIGHIAEAMLDNLETTGTLSGSGDSIQPPTTYLWTAYFLALHYSHPLNNSHPSPSTSLSILSAAIAHTPTLPELYTARARILKYAGDPWGAAVQMEEARRLDGQDRFLNSKAAKYWLRAGEFEKAYSVLGLFTKKDAASPAADLVEMQCEWFILEDAEAHTRSGNLGMALKRYHQLDTVFADIEDDQFDFHGYCLRKCTLREYKNMIQFETDVRSSANYLRAALAAIKIYIRLADEPDLAQKTQAIQDAGPAVEARQMAEDKAREATEKAAALKKLEDAKKGTNAVADIDPPQPKDEDPTGSKLLATSEPLEAAAKLLRPVEASHKAQSNVEVWLAVYDVAVRRQRYLQAAKALNAASSLASAHADVQYRIVHFKHTIESISSSLSSESQFAITATLSRLGVDAAESPLALAQRFLSTAPNDPAHILAAARSILSLGGAVPDVESTIFELLNEQGSASVGHASEGLALLQKVESAQLEEFRTRCRERWELARCFDVDEEKAATRSEWQSKQSVAPGKDVKGVSRVSQGKA